MEPQDLQIGQTVLFIIGDYVRDASGTSRFVRHEVEAVVLELRGNGTVNVTYKCPFMNLPAETTTHPMMLRSPPPKENP